MKVCFAGMGSIGKRHLKNLIAVSKEFNLELEIHAYRESNRVLEKEISELIDRQIIQEEHLHNNYDIVFITNPTYLHYKTIRLFSNKAKNMFIEKPLFDDITYDVSSLNLREDGIYHVAAPLRHTEVIQCLKDILEDERVYSVRTICSSYLPDWRPDTDYRKVYSAKKSKGGGVSVDLIHEWDYITYLFEFPKKIFNLQGKFSHLEIDSEDLSVYIAEYSDKLIELHLDYFGRVPKRQIEIYTKTGTITGDFISNEISFTDGREKMRFSCNHNDMYLREIKYFLSCVLCNRKTKNNIRHAYRVLKLAKGIV